MLRERSLSETRFLKGLQKVVIDNRVDELNLPLNKFDYASLDRQDRGLELTLSQKLKVVDNLSGLNFSIDFAGGDPLSCLENFIVIREVCNRIGKENVSITSTGHSINRYGYELVSSIIGEYEFTYDESSFSDPKNRPKGYNKSNIYAARKMASLGVKTKCQIPIHDGNCSLEQIQKIYLELASANISEILLMRVFPVGRGARYLKSQGEIGAEVYKSVIKAYRECEKIFSGPKVRLQCALKHLESVMGPNPCDLMHSSFGIASNGSLLLSAWATNDVGLPLSNDFILGDLSKAHFASLMQTSKVKNYRARLDDNYGHCKIFSYQYSEKNDEDAIFGKADPLYNQLQNRIRLIEV